MAIITIHLNRQGINSLELSAKSVSVSAGTSLYIKIINNGAPTHATLRCDGKMYTDFTYENIYVENESEQEIKINEDAGSGDFKMNVITGYGMRKEEFTVNVMKSCPVLEPESIDPSTTQTSDGDDVKIGSKVAVLAFTIFGGLILIAMKHFSVFSDIKGFIMATLLYIVMSIGILVTWHLSQ